MNDSALVTTREASRQVNVTPATIRRWAADGRLAPAGVRGRETVYLLADVFDAERKASLRRRWRDTKAGRRLPHGKCVMRMGEEKPCAQPAVPDAPVQLCPDHLIACYTYVADILEGRVTEFYHKAIQELDGKPPPQGYVYFIGYTDRIKIGHSITPKDRTAAFQPDQVLLVLPGTRAHEKALHALFKPHRIRGEWFHRDQELLDFIAEHADDNLWDTETGNLKAA